MKALATQIGNSAKECITIDGELFLKSVTIGRWEYIVKVTITSGLNQGEFFGKSATRESAAKWCPFPMSDDYYAGQGVGYEAAIARGVKPTKINGCLIAREAVQYNREIFKIER